MIVYILEVFIVSITYNFDLPLVFCYTVSQRRSHDLNQSLQSIAKYCDNDFTMVTLIASISDAQQSKH